MGYFDDNYIMIFVNFICGELDCSVVPDLLVIDSNPELNNMAVAEHQILRWSIGDNNTTCTFSYVVLYVLHTHLQHHNFHM